MKNSRGPSHNKVPRERSRLPESRYPAGENQRSYRRYPLDLDVGYTISGEQRTAIAGRGRVIDLSSSGIRFVADAPLPIGLPITVSIMWPRPAGCRVERQLIASGRIVRTREVETAVQIMRYEFFTRTGTMIDTQ